MTGAAHGIGLATAERLTRGGAAVLLADVDGSAVEAAASSLMAQGREVAAMRAEVPRRVEAAALICGLAPVEASFTTGQCFDVSGGRGTR